MASDSIKVSGGGVVFAGSKAVDVFVVLSLASGLRMYAKSKIKPNSNWSPTNMLKTASGYTGKKYKRGEYEKAADDLTAVAEETRAKIQA